MAMNKDILQILEQYNITIPYLRVYTNRISGKCPFHDGEHKDSLSMDLQSGLWRCFSCPAKGNLQQFIQQYRKKYGLPDNQEIPEFKITAPSIDRHRYLTDKELEILTYYCNGLSGLMLGKRQNVDSSPWLEYLYSRGFEDRTIQYFKLGTNAMPNYGSYFTKEFSEKLNRDVADILKSLRLTNDKGDYWWKPAIIIPYYSSDQCFFANARILPEHVDGGKYIGMSGIHRTCFFHDDALDYGDDDLFVVEGEFNAMALWQIGFQNVVSFGGKQSFNDSLISSLYGRDVTLYFDSDKGDPTFEARTEVIKKLQETAKSVSYFELPEGVDINDFLQKNSPRQFVEYLMQNTVIVDDSDDFLSSEYRSIPENERDKVISLAEAQTINTTFFKHVADNFSCYSGKRILVNMPVGTGKTTGAINLVNSRKEKILILTSTHFEADVYELEQNLDFDCFTVHLKGRGHADIGCPYADVAESLGKLGYSLKFQMKYCNGICSKPYLLDQEGESGTCLHIKLMEAAKYAGVLITVHAHSGLKDFFISPYYGNKRRSLIIIDEQCDLTKKVYFDRKTIAYNIELLRQIITMDVSDETKAVANELWGLLSRMEYSIDCRQKFSAKVTHFSTQEIYEIDKAICRQNVSDTLPNILYDLVYALENDPDNDGMIELQYDLDPERLFYIWRAKLPERACVIFMSATTSQKYLEQVLGVTVDIVVGEQYNIKRENLEIIQLLNVVGGRGRLLKDPELQDSIKAFFGAVLAKHKDNRIMVITSLGGNIKNTVKEGSAKQRVIDLLDPIAITFGRQLISVGTKDIEQGDVPDSFFQIPVIHFGIQGTNVFADYDVLVEINAHYYRQDDLIEGAEIAFDIEIAEQKPEKKQVSFRTQDKEYTITKYIHTDQWINTYIENTQSGDMMQVEGRILRGKDTPKTIYRLHNVNIKPYPTKVYKSWTSLMANEFGVKKDQTVIKGKLRQVLDWIQENRKVDQTFSTKEVVKILGGYAHDMNRRYLKKLQELGYVSQRISGGEGQGDGAVWDRKV